MLALALLDAVVALDWHSSWLQYAAAKGYLQNVCASVQWEGESLLKLLQPVPDSIKTLYIYESKMVL